MACGGCGHRYAPMAPKPILVPPSRGGGYVSPQIKKSSIPTSLPFPPFRPKMVPPKNG